MSDLLSQEDFLQKYKISSEEYDNTGFKWSDLVDIYNNHSTQESTHESTAQYLTNILIKVKGVHSIRYRVKDGEHLIEKIIRKKIVTPDRVINIENYQSEITDIVGIRIIHLFKEQWHDIHTIITEKWNLKEKPIVYIRIGDAANLEEFEQCGCDVKRHPAGYRSLHYILETQPNKIKYYCEIQMRTIFEEGWSEIDHKIRYPYDVNNKIHNEFLSILNRLAGSADEMGSFISNLKPKLDEMQKAFDEKLQEKDEAIDELQQKIKSLSISQKQKTELTANINRISAAAITTSALETFKKLIRQTKPVLSTQQIDEYLVQAVRQAADDEGWAYIGSVGFYLKTYTPVDYKELGFAQLKTFLMSKNEQFEIKEMKKSEKALNTDSTYVRVKQ